MKTRIRISGLGSHAKVSVLSRTDISQLEKALLELRVSLASFIKGYEDMAWEADGHRKTFTAHAMWLYMSTEGYSLWKKIPRHRRRKPDKTLISFMKSGEAPCRSVKLSVVYRASELLGMDIATFIGNVYRYAPDDAADESGFPASREDKRYYAEPLSPQIRALVYLACILCPIHVPFAVKGLLMKIKNGWDPYLSTLSSAMDAMGINIDEFFRATESGDTFTLQPSEHYHATRFGRDILIEYIRHEYRKRNLQISECAAICSVTPKEMGRLLQMNKRKSISILVLKRLILPLNMNLSELFENTRKYMEERETN